MICRRTLKWLAKDYEGLVHMLKSIMWILFQSKCEVERFKKNRKERGQEKERENEREKIVNTHGSNGVPFVLLHLRLLSGEGPRVLLLRVPHFYIVRVPGVLRGCSQAVPGIHRDYSHNLG